MEYLLWTDVETTGTNPWKGEKLLEISSIITDQFSNRMTTPFSRVIFHPDADNLRESSSDLVREMHDRTGLWEKLKNGDPIESVDRDLYELMVQISPEPMSIRVAGSSCRLDLNFIEEYLPKTYSHLHYRSVDVSSLAYTLVDRWNLADEYYEKQKVHTAEEDIRETMEEDRYLYEEMLRHRLR